MSKFYLLAFLATVMMLAGCVSIVVIQPGQVGAVFNVLSGNLEEPLMPGSHIAPWTEQVMLFPSSSQQYTFSGTEGPDATIQTRSLDGQVIGFDLTILFRIDPLEVNKVFVRWGDTYASNFIRPTVRGMVRDVASGFEAEEIYGQGRLLFEETLKARLDARLHEEGFILEEVLVRDIQFAQLFREFMEQQYFATATAEAAQQNATPTPNS